MRKKDILFFSFVFSLMGFALGQNANPIVFTAEDNQGLIEARIEISPPPAYNQESTLKILLRAASPELNRRIIARPRVMPNDPRIKPLGKQIDLLKETDTISAMELMLSAGPQPYIHLPDTTLHWSTPIKAGDSLLISLPLKITGVGEFNLTLTEQGYARDFIQFPFTIVVDEEELPDYIGKSPAPFANPLKAHPFAFGDKLTDRIMGEKLNYRFGREVASQPFDIKLTIEPNLRVGHTSEVRLEIAPMTSRLTDLQYEIIHATNLSIDTLPPSPGDNPGENANLTLVFAVVPNSVGRSFLSIEIFGYDAQSKVAKLQGTTWQAHLIFAEDSSLLYAGALDPFAVGYIPGNPAYKKIAGISQQIETRYGLKTLRSQPDFEWERLNQARIQDSLRALQRADSLQKIEKK